MASAVAWRCCCLRISIYKKNRSEQGKPCVCKVLFGKPLEESKLENKRKSEKVAIITMYHGSCNFGGLLQAYALPAALEKHLQIKVYCGQDGNGSIQK